MRLPQRELADAGLAGPASDRSAQFPALAGGIAYLDSAATSQTPEPVLAAIERYYREYRASVHRGTYEIAERATTEFEGARARIADALRSTVEETIFTANATAAINLVAYAWGLQNLGEGDLVVLSEAEHHSNIVPWQLVCGMRGASIQYVPVDPDGQLDQEVYDELLERGPKLVGIFHVSNVLGTINPVASMVARAHAAGAVVVVDGTQGVPQLPVDLGELGADFYAWTGHKAYGPTGIGVLHGRRELLEAMPPFLGGGHMIRQVLEQTSTYTELPWKFEAGTSQIAEAIGLGAAVDFIREIGIEQIRSHEQAITAYALERLAEVPGLRVFGPADPAARGALVSFALTGAHPHDISEILGRGGVCVRAGHHCAQPLMRALGVGATTRASFAVHTSSEDIDRLIDGLHEVRRVLQVEDA